MTVGAQLDAEELGLLDAYWRAANYLSVGQIYLLDNPLLREPLRLEHVKPRLLGHWGTTPGLNFIYAHLNRAIQARDLNAIYVTGPGHGGPGARRQHLPRGHLLRGLPARSAATRRACASCSGSSPSPAASRATSRPRRRARSTRAASSATRSCTPTARRSTTPTCSSAASSATARPRPARWPRAGTRTSSSTRRATAPCCRSCTSTATRSPTRRCSRASRRTSCAACCAGYGHEPYFVEGDDPEADAPGAGGDARRVVLARSRAIQRARGGAERPRWPMIVLRTPKGWTGPGGRRSRSRARSARTRCRSRGSRRPRAPAPSSRRWMRSYRPEELFDEDGALVAELAALAPAGRAADGREPARQRRRCCCATSTCRTSATTPSTSRRRRRRRARRRACSATFLRDVMRRNPETFRLFGPDETASNRLGAVFEVTDRAWDGRDRCRPTTTSRPTAA